MMSAREEFGARLRRAREAKGLSVKEIATATKISVLVLEALERSDVSRLPGGLFSRSFVRAYAREVGLDPEETVAAFVEAFPDEFSAGLQHDVSRSRASRPLVESGTSHTGRWLGLAVTIILIIAFFGVSRYLNRGAAAPPAQTPARQSAQTPQASAPFTNSHDAAAASQPSSTSQPGNQQSGTIASPSASPQPPGTSQPSPTGGQPGAPAAAAGTVTPASETALAAPTALNVALVASAECWVSARTDGERGVRRTLTTGERLELHAAESVVLTLGNAAAITYTINGVAGRPLGDPGKVVTAVITTANYQTFTAGR